MCDVIKRRNQSYCQCLKSPEQCDRESLSSIVIRYDRFRDEFTQSRLDDSGFFGRNSLRYTPSLQLHDEGGVELT